MPYRDIMMLENPRYRARRRHRRNPAKGVRAITRQVPGGKLFKDWMHNVDLMDAGAAVGGLALASWLPFLLVKDIGTPMGKALRIAAGLGTAMVAGYAGHSVSPSVGKAAVLGSLAGVGAQTFSMLTGRTIAGLLGPGGRRPGRIGETTLVSQPFTREGERVSVIQP